LQAEIERLFDQKPSFYTDEDSSCSSGSNPRSTKAECARGALPETRTGWRVNAWVKKGILLGFRMGAVIDMSVDSERQPFFDNPHSGQALRRAERRAHCARRLQHPRRLLYRPGVVCMPPMFINVGAWVDDGTMVDSHALVGSCAQWAGTAHLGASQIGGVLEPVAPCR